MRFWRWTATPRLPSGGTSLHRLTHPHTHNTPPTPRTRTLGKGPAHFQCIHNLGRSGRAIPLKMAGPKSPPLKKSQGGIFWPLPTRLLNWVLMFALFLFFSAFPTDTSALTGTASTGTTARTAPCGQSTPQSPARQREIGPPCQPRSAKVRSCCRCCC